MKRVLLVVIVTIAVTASTAVAQNYGTIGVYADFGGCDCEIDDLFAGMVTVYVVHRGIVDGVTASQFVVEGSGGMAMVHVSEASIGGPIHITGSIVDGYGVHYGTCVTGDLTIMTIQYFAQGTSAQCSRLDVVAAPTSVLGEVEVSDCDYQLHAATGLGAYVNATIDCACTSALCTPVPVEEKTWGGIKALYR
jgi:hypothetical protein